MRIGRRGSFRDATPLLGSPSRLRERLEADGYLLVRGAIDATRLQAVRRDVLEVCARHGWLAPDAPIENGIATGPARFEPMEEYLRVNDDVQRLETFRRLAFDPGILRVARSIVDGPVFVHPMCISRLMFPRNHVQTSPPHQDFPNVQGVPDTYTFWIPLGACPRTLGGLAVLEGSHRFGELAMVPATGAGMRTCILTNEMRRLRWLSGDFQSGDLLVFHGLTVHRALENRSRDRLRVSADFRYQAVTDPVSESALQPHYRRLTWEQIYDGWTSDEGQYYWRDVPLRVVAFRAPEPFPAGTPTRIAPSEGLGPWTRLRLWLESLRWRAGGP